MRLFGSLTRCMKMPKKTKHNKQSKKKNIYYPSIDAANKMAAVYEHFEKAAIKLNNSKVKR